MSICLGVSAVAVPTGVSAYKRWRDANRRATLQDYLQSSDPEAQWKLTEEAEEEREENKGEGPMDEEWDEPFMRAIAWRGFYGQPTPELTARWAQIANDESRKWADLMPGAKRRSAALNGLSWVNLGPTDAKFQFNGTRYTQVDSGRPTSIVVHPSNPDIVYVATSGGGVWKTFDFSSADPVWFPVTETIGNLATGGLAMDPKHPETLYLGLGDSFDVAGGQVLKTTDGGATWSAPVTLTGTYDLGTAVLNVTALRIRTVQVDPNNTNIVFVGSNVGLFRSTDGGQSFSLVDLPNSGANKLAESVWSIVYTGQVGGVSRWALSGVYASAVGALPPDAGQGTSATPGDIWVSTDAGASWSSRKAAGSLPGTSVGRIDLAAGTPSAADGVTTVVYAQLAAASETASAGYWRSMNSGQSFSLMAGTMGNPTTTSTNCQNPNTSGAQAYYGQAIAVDPANNDNVIVGGVYCGLRTRNGTASTPLWENVAHWLPTGGGGDTATGRLPYVHADWHTMTFVRTAKGYTVLAGTDGGIFASTDVFDGSPANDTTITWRFPNRGIVTHLFYSVSSGDETTGNAFVAYGGLQDNGTRFRDSKTASTTFNQVVGGDGIGSAVVQVPGDTTYWASVQFSPRLCDPDQYDCNVGSNWFRYDPTLDGPLACAGDSVPFLVHLANVPTATASTGAGVLLSTTLGVYRYKGDPFVSPDPWEELGSRTKTDGTGVCAPTGSSQRNFLLPSATVDGVYGVPMSGGRFRVTSNCTMSTPGNQCVWSVTNVLGVDLNGNGTVETSERVLNTAYIDFPPGPTAEAAGKVFVVTSTAPSAASGGPVPDALGHVFITRDGGLTWSVLKGNGTGFDLPNVPVSVIRFDPGDLTNNTLYAGTDIGMYRTTDGGQTWQRFGYGLPMVKVTDIFVSRTGAFLRISTYGRGLWEIHPSATADKGVNGNGDFDRNQQIDFVDLLSTANRLGTTPVTGAAPFYDWNQDQTGSVNAIDDADLSQLLTRYGGRP
ncbi:hypothetical protein [Archangium sp.]|uniref:hypothetical protein n=1 Tax=Archangium sp. TaxID=1872627 RepID=UPI00389A7E8E